jgi:hypothetical protein
LVYKDREPLPAPTKCLKKKILQLFKKKITLKRKKKMSMLARPLLITKGKKKKKNYIYMGKLTFKKNFIKKKNIQQLLNAHSLRNMNGRTEQFYEKKIIYLSGETLELLHQKTNHQKPLNQELRLCASSSPLGNLSHCKH